MNRGDYGMKVFQILKPRGSGHSESAGVWASRSFLRRYANFGQGRRPVNLVLKGGGAKGVALMGAYRALAERVDVKSVCGTSAGAITGSLIAAGYNPDELQQSVVNMDLTQFFDERDWSTDDTVRLHARHWKEKDPLSRFVLWVDPTYFASRPERTGIGPVDNSRLRRTMFALKDVSLTGLATMGGGFVEWLIGLPHGTATTTLSGIQKGDITQAAHIVRYAVEYAVNSSGGKIPAAIYEKLTNPDKSVQIPLAIYYMGGAFKGDQLVEKLEEMLHAKIRPANGRYVTFHDLPMDLKVVCADITNHRMLVLPDDLAKEPYGYDDPKAFRVAEAVRASISLPIVYEPFRLPYAKSPDQYATLLDGGVVSNFPVRVYDGSPYMTVGLWLGQDEEPAAHESQPQQANQIGPVMRGVLQTMQESGDVFSLEAMRAKGSVAVVQLPLDVPLTPEEQARFRSQGLEVPESRPVTTLEFELSPAQKERLIANAHAATIAALQEFEGN